MWKKIAVTERRVREAELCELSDQSITAVTAASSDEGEHRKTKTRLSSGAPTSGHRHAPTTGSSRVHLWQTDFIGPKKEGTLWSLKVVTADKTMSLENS